MPDAEIPERSPRMEAALKKARRTLFLLAEATPKDIPFEDREVILATYTSQMLEHFEAIILLLEAKVCPGSALALFRPLIEVRMRGAWLACRASDAQVKRFMSERGYRFPPFAVIAKDLDSQPSGDSLLAGYFDRFVKAYSHMCDFTHGGHILMSGRISERGIMPDYPEDVLIALLQEAEKATIFHLVFFCSFVDYDAGTEAVLKLANEL